MTAGLRLITTMAASVSLAAVSTWKMRPRRVRPRGRRPDQRRRNRGVEAKAQVLLLPETLEDEICMVREEWQQCVREECS